MKTFKDKTGTQWTIDITVTTIKRVKSMLDIDLLTAADGELMQRLASDEVLMVDLIYAICYPQCEDRSVTDEQFGELLVGDSIDAAYTAFLEELADFFRDPAKRRVMRTLLDKQKLIEKRQMEMLEQKLSDPRIDALIDSEVTKAGDEFTKRLASLESTPDL